MAARDDLGIRMKEFYEGISKTKLMRRTPVMIRIDGKAFHTFTRGFAKPFDEVLMKSMQETTKYLCENIQGCVLGYTQSDEITLVLVDYKKLNSAAWFDYEVQKMCSVSASMATMAFNKAFKKNMDAFAQNLEQEKQTLNEEEQEKQNRLLTVYQKAYEIGGMFDSRCFNIPKEEVTNCVYWRQLDASRNSIQMVGHANFSNKEMMNKSCSNIQDMLMEQKNINWNDFPVYQKRGTCLIKESYYLYVDETGNAREVSEKEAAQLEQVTKRSRWIVDEQIPIFNGDGRNYVEQLLWIEE